MKQTFYWLLVGFGILVVLLLAGALPNLVRSDVPSEDTRPAAMSVADAARSDSEVSDEPAMSRTAVEEVRADPTLELEIMVSDASTREPCAGVELSVFAAEDLAGVVDESPASGLIEGWDRVLVRRDGAVIGVPVPGRFGPPVGGGIGAADAALRIAAEAVTGADGLAVVRVPIGLAHLRVRARSGVREAGAVAARPYGRLHIELPGRMSHRYEVAVREGPGSPEALYAVRRRTASVVPMIHVGTGSFDGPDPREWVPYLYSDSGFALGEPVDLTSTEPVRFEAVPLCDFDVTDAATGLAVRAIRVVTVERTTGFVQDARALHAESGRYFLNRPTSAVDRLVMAAGYRSEWVDGNARSVRLSEGGDPEVVLETEQPPAEPLDVDVCIVTPGSADVEFDPSSVLHTLRHTGRRSRHRLPAGAYLLKCRADDYAIERLDLRESSREAILLRPAARLLVRPSARVGSQRDGSVRSCRPGA